MAAADSSERASSVTALFLWHHKDMAAAERSDVEERVDAIVLKDVERRDFALDDAGEEGGHACMIWTTLGIEGHRGCRLHGEAEYGITTISPCLPSPPHPAIKPLPHARR